MKVVIIHGIPADVECEQNIEERSYDKHWMPWIEQECSKKGIEVIKPIMPDAWAPDYGFWKDTFEKLKIDEEDILVGHSGGCAFLVRWLGETEKKVKKLILVAPWKIQSPEFSEGENELYDFKINRRISKNVEKRIIFTSSDEEEDGKKSAKIYADFLNANLIEMENRGHFTFGDMGTEMFPELLEEILK